MIRVSSGTASILGLKKIRQFYPPTTAYLMIGERCLYSCSYCAHSRDASSRLDFLSRISWPKFDKHDVRHNLKKAESDGKIRRVCIQVVNSKGAEEKSLELVKCLREEITLPISLSICPSRNLAKKAKNAGITTICHALDAPTPYIFRKHRQGNWHTILSYLEEALKYFPDNVTTHLMVGLGETPEEMINTIYLLKNKGIKTALFAFTPLPGTRLANQSPPELKYYRWIQLANFLINKGESLADALNPTEGIFSRWKKSGDINKMFMTSGCVDCNRPYYNERPGQRLYNYPRPLEEEELWKELALAMEAVNCFSQVS
ncbi:MAG: radical SAM protein [Candidatus Eremiobacteraeota bacterium]|nr:radical SAM protein [Candidatus Eremiobacteraeota bacterium]